MGALHWVAFFRFLSLSNSSSTTNLLPLVDLFEDMPDSTWDDTLIFLRRLLGHLSSHSVGLTTPSLAIGKDTHIIAIEETLNQVLNFEVNIILRRFLSKYTIEVEYLLASPSVRFD
jgi:hypothetical protein